MDGHNMELETWLDLDSQRTDCCSPAGTKSLLPPPCPFSLSRNKKCHVPHTGHYLTTLWGWAPHGFLQQSLPAEQRPHSFGLSPGNQPLLMGKRTGYRMEPARLTSCEKSGKGWATGAKENSHFSDKFQMDYFTIPWVQGSRTRWQRCQQHLSGDLLWAAQGQVLSRQSGKCMLIIFFPAGTQWKASLVTKPVFFMCNIYIL
jgi:hypothetical protein